MKNKKVCFITTVNHNVGDDFVREGIKFLIKKHFKSRNLLFTNIHKHAPITARYGFEWFRYNRLAKRFDHCLPLFFTRDKLIEADLIIQSGAPVYWHFGEKEHCAFNEWFIPLMQRRFKRKMEKAKVFNLAAGTCQPYFSDESEFIHCDQCTRYIKKLYNLSTVTTVRDKLAKTVFNRYGLNVPLIPCSSIFAVDEHQLKPDKKEYVVLNYMDGGGHYKLGQNIESKRWFNEFKVFYTQLKKNNNVVFCCHNQKEVHEVHKIDSQAKIFFEKANFIEYMKFYSKAKYGIMNRVHGAFLIASYGRPSIIIGTDSRAKMGNEIGLESFFVNEINSDILCAKAKELELKAKEFKEHFKIIKKNAFNHYIEALSPVCD
jgi:hypothetical protein